MSPPRGFEGRRLAVAVVLLGCAFTGAAWLVPGFDVAYGGEGMHIALEAIEATVFLVVGGLAWTRYSRSELISDLAVAVTFGVVLPIEAAVLLALPTLLNYELLRPFSVWSSALTTVLASQLLFAGSLAGERRVRRPLAARIGALAIPVLIAIGALALLTYEQRLTLPLNPGLSPVAPGREPFAGSTTILLLLASAGLFLLLAGAVFARPRTRVEQPLLGWLGPAVIAGGLASFNYALFPSLYSYWVYAGDELWLFACVLLTWGVVVELRAAARRSIEYAVLEERRRLARDLHDGVAQELAFISAELVDLPAGAHPSLNWIRSAAERGLYESRRAIAALTLPLDLPLADAIAATVDEIAMRAGMAVRLELDDSVVASPARQEVMLRVVREAATNSIRHAKASRVSVALAAAPSGLTRLVISDDGVGLAEGSHGAGFGLTSMQERVNASGGTFKVDSAPGSGTIVEASWAGNV